MTGSAKRERIGARRAALQALYQWQLAGQEPGDIVREFVSDRELIRVDREYFREITCGVANNFQSLHDELVTVIDREWERLDPVERAALLIGVWELANRPEVPWRVVVNEAVELAKMFGAEDGHKFINGSLDQLARRLRAQEIQAAAG